MSSRCTQWDRIGKRCNYSNGQTMCVHHDEGFKCRVMGDLDEKTRMKSNLEKIEDEKRREYIYRHPDR